MPHTLDTPATGHPLRQPQDDQDFLLRVLRWIAILCIAYGLFRLANYGATIAQGGFARFGVGQFRSLGFSLGLLLLVTNVLLLVGGAALLGRKRWGRTLLLLWAATGAAVHLGSSVLYLLNFNSSAGGTAPGNSPGYFFWMMFTYFIDAMAFPLLVAIVLLQREVAQLWAEPGGGAFEVVPMAIVVTPDRGAAP